MKNFMQADDKRKDLKSDELTAAIKRIFVEDDGVEDITVSEMSTFARSEIWFQSQSCEAELRLLVMYDGVFIVSRVQVMHPRQGIFTKIIAVIEEHAKKLGSACIKISSVETPEMAAWCRKNFFDPVETTSFKTDQGLIMGDYRRQVYFSHTDTQC